MPGPLAAFDWWRAQQTCGALGYPYQDVTTDGVVKVPDVDLGSAGSAVGPVKLQLEAEARRALDSFDAEAELAKAEEGSGPGCGLLPFNSPAPPVAAADLDQEEVGQQPGAPAVEVPPKLEEISLHFRRGELDAPAEGVPASPVYTRTSPQPDSQAEPPIDALVDTNLLPVANQIDAVEMASLHRYVTTRAEAYAGEGFLTAHSSPQGADDPLVSQQAQEPPGASGPGAAEGDTMLGESAELLLLGAPNYSGAEPGFGFRNLEES